MRMSLTPTRGLPSSPGTEQVLGEEHSDTATSYGGQDMTVTAEPLSESSSRLVLSGETANRGEYGTWGERGRIAKGLAASVRFSTSIRMTSIPGQGRRARAR